MRHVIKLCLSGMMQAYSESRFIYARDTKSAPTEHAIIGIIAAAEVSCERIRMHWKN